MPRRAHGWTLIELAVVMSIIAIAVGILLPGLAAARQSGRRVVCLSQLRQIGLATTVYAQDYRGYWPRSSHSAFAFGVRSWGYQLPPYLHKGHLSYGDPGWMALFNGLYRCPEDPRQGDQWSYGKSVWLELSTAETATVPGTPAGATYWTEDQLPNPARTIVYAELNRAMLSMADHLMAHFWYIGGEPEVDRRRHGTQSAFAYADGHAQSQPFDATFDLSRPIDRWNPGHDQ